MSADQVHFSSTAEAAERQGFPVTTHPRVQRPRRRGDGWLWLTLAALMLLVLALAGGAAYVYRSYEGRIYPNVSIQGIAVGDMTPDQAEAALRARYAAFLRQPLIITYGDRQWTPTLDDLGMTFDFRGAVDRAYNAGRGNGLIGDVQEIAAIWQHGLEIPLRVSYDEMRAQAYLAHLAREIERAPADAQVRLDGEQVATVGSVIGRQVLVDATLSQVSQQLQSLAPATIPIQTRELPPRLDDAAVAAARSRIETILQGPLSLRVGKHEYEWTVDELAQMIVIERVPSGEGDRVVVTLDRSAIEQRLRQIADETEKPGTRPRVAWNNGDLKITKPGKPGLRLDEARARDMVLAALTGRDRTLDLPMIPTDPPVTEANLHQLGIRELVSVGKSDFTGSAAYRVHNIGVGMQLLNGLLVAPGEEFSFNKNIGQINAANGFVEGAAIIQNRTQQEFGGGICQDSTTLFRAAFWAGLPITERWGHSFYISWYDKYALGPRGNGPGLDATIFTGGPDLKFVNDTGAWLLIQAWSDPKTGVAQIELYGTKPNRTVDLTHKVYDHTPAPTEPVFVADPKVPQGTIKHTDKARGGMTIDVYRLVIENGVPRPPELFRTRFRPWPNIYTLNPADIGPDSKPLIPFPSNEQPAQPAPPVEQPTEPPPPPGVEPQPEQNSGEQPPANG
ncbi:VanW family protein [Roseiflexus castenholzii]|uniref:VanW family protein n=1 Tax=Roseiflexus castenholzii (strain DSM 13941 / HLO8) TaxID=383372 RepID=A7NLR5_ROSCS|nr:peptidoglycan binding domain-containing protein [Roseiflexus castenholzii]ABU58461.1 VanW family protein [Roseiflexus castenholzii DSM 13941]